LVFKIIQTSMNVSDLGGIEIIERVGDRIRDELANIVCDIEAIKPDI